MRAAHVGEHVAPVIVVLNEIALRETNAIGLTAIRVDAVHRDRRDRVILGAAAQDAFHPARPAVNVVQGVRREGVRPGHLPGTCQVWFKAENCGMARPRRSSEESGKG